MELIGRGGMGAVYRAHHILMDKPVAVKVLRAELASDTEAVARFHREARSASRLDHESIIRVTDFGQTDDGLLFLVMELLDGENLAQVLKRGSLSWRRAATIGRDIAMGLGHAHEQGVIHRDLKPENVVILVRGKGRQLVKVLDFGLAKLMHEVGPQGSGNDEEGQGRSLTRTGVVFGTPEYMSPEQAEGRALGPHTDLYALGVVLYQMVTGNLPFSAPTFIALIAKTVHEPPPLPSLQVPNGKLPKSLEELILRCLAKAPDDRPTNAEEIADELDSILAQNLEDIADDGPAASIAVAKPSPSQPPASASKPTPPQGEPPPGGVAKTVQRVAAPARSGKATTPAPSTAAVASAFEALGKRGQPISGSPKSMAVPIAAAVPSQTADGGVDELASASPIAPSNAAASSHTPLEPSPPPDEFRGRTEAVPQAESRSSVSSGPVRVPHRPYWIVGAVLVASLVGAGSYLGPKLVRRSLTTNLEENDDLRQARLLLASDKSNAGTEAAIRKLLLVRQKQENAELHRLLSGAYEAQNNRLRALGHMHLAVQRSQTMVERTQSQLALAQLLSRMGHGQEACQTTHRLLHERPAPTGEIKVHALALVSTLKCDVK